MKTKHMSSIKMLLAIVPALLLVLILKPTAALAYQVTFLAGDHGHFLQGDGDTCIQQTDTALGIFDSTYDMLLERDAGWELDYWIANYDVEDTRTGNVIVAGKKIPTDNMAFVIKPTHDTTFTPYYKEFWAAITYTTDGNGSVSPTSEHLTLTESWTIHDGDGTQVRVGHPAVATPTPNKGYEFDYWTSDKDLYELHTGPNDLDPIEANTPLTTDQLRGYYISQDTTLTAHFKKTSSDPDPADTDDSTTVKPADGTDSKALPKTGDALPGTAAVALGSAAAIAAAASLLRRRCF